MVESSIHFHIQSPTCHRLCNVRFTSVRAKMNLSDVTINGRNGDFNPTSLAQVINTDTINNMVVRAWIDRAGNFPTALSSDHSSYFVYSSN